MTDGWLEDAGCRATTFYNFPSFARVAHMNVLASPLPREPPRRWCTFRIRKQINLNSCQNNCSQVGWECFHAREGEVRKLGNGMGGKK